MPPPPSHAGRLYAHIHTFEVICPRCGRFYRHGGWGPRPAEKPKTGGYDTGTGVYTCPGYVQGRPCGYRAYVGVVLWPLRASKAPRPADHVLTPGEAVARRVDREAASYEARGRLGGRRERVTNVECTCGEDGAGRASCAVHTPPGPTQLGTRATPEWQERRRKLEEDP